MRERENIEIYPITCVRVVDAKGSSQPKPNNFLFLILQYVASRVSNTRRRHPSVRNRYKEEKQFRTIQILIVDLDN